MSNQEALKVRSLIDKHIKNQNLETTSSTFDVTINGKTVAKQYTVIGPQGYAERISNYIDTISKSKYGNEMLKSLAGSDDKLYIMYAKGEWNASKQVADPYGKPDSQDKATIISFDPDRKKPYFATTGVDKYLESRGVRNEHNIEINQPDNSGFRALIPAMTLAHELFHAWQNTGKAPKGDYFTQNHYHQPNISGDRIQEGNALRYTNQIRMDLGLGYIRTQYSVMGHQNVDSYLRAIKRWEKNTPESDKAEQATTEKTSSSEAKSDKSASPFQAAINRLAEQAINAQKADQHRKQEQPALEAGI